MGMTWYQRASSAPVTRRMQPPLPAASLPSNTAITDMYLNLGSRVSWLSRFCSFSSLSL